MKNATVGTSHKKRPADTAALVFMVVVVGASSLTSEA
jgi:hypothetical protein